MSAFDRLQMYSAKEGLPNTSADDIRVSEQAQYDNPVFDVSQPEGAFLARVHQCGFKLYEYQYILREPNNLDEELKQDGTYIEGRVVSDDEYQFLSEQSKTAFHREFHFTELYNVLTTTGNQVINAIAGAGKALQNGTKVVTPDGYRNIEDLCVGDSVYGVDGLEHKVLGVYPQGERDCYNMTFSNNYSIPCDGDHLWGVYDDENNYEVLKTTDIMGTAKLRHLPTCNGVKFGARGTDEYVIHPYVMGVLLASGCFYMESDEIRLNYIPQAVVDKVNTLGIIAVPSEECYPIRDILDDVRIKSDVLLELYTGIVPRLDGDYDNRRVKGGMNGGVLLEYIPKQYLLDANVQSRLALLNGIIDSYFAFDAKKKCYVGSLNLGFYKDVVFLAESLGLTTCEEYKNDKYVVEIYVSKFLKQLHTIECSRFDKYEVGDIEPLYIIGVEKVGTAEMTCIEIDSEDKLYLTEHFIPTHNTTSLVFKIMHDIVTGEVMRMQAVPNGTVVPMVNKVWVCTFLRTGAEDLHDNMLAWQRKLGYYQTGDQVVFSTLDAEFKRCLNAMGVETRIGSPEDLMNCLKSAINSCNIKREGAELTKEDYPIINSIVTYYRGRLDEKRFSHPSAREYGLTPTILQMVVHQYETLRRARGIVDFEEITEYLYKYLYVTPNESVRNFVANRYNYIYIDEFQDTSQMQYAILRCYARGNLWCNVSGTDAADPMYTGQETLGKIVVIGDPSQCFSPENTVSGVGVMSRVSVKDAEVDTAIRSIGAYAKERATVVEDVIKSEYNGMMYKIILEDGRFETVTQSHGVFKFIKNYVSVSEFISDVTKNEENDEIIVTTVDETTAYMTEKLYVRAVYNATKEFKCVGGIEDVKHSEHVTRYFIMRLPLNDVRGVYVFKMVAAEQIYDDLIAYDEAVKNGDSSEASKGVFICATEKEEVKFAPCKVKEVWKFEYHGDVYDINTKNHFLCVNGGILSHNCIYSFKGSDSKILVEKFDNDFRPTFCTLSYNYRCPSNILNPVVPSIHKNPDSANQKIIASREGGDFAVYEFGDFRRMVEQLGSDIAEDLNSKNNVAILCRTNFDGMIPAFILEAEHEFDFGISGTNMTMNSPLPRKLMGISSLFMEKSTPAVKASLVMCCNARGAEHEVKELMDILKMNGKSVWDVSEDDLLYSCPNLVDFVRSVKKILFVDGKRSREREIEALKFIYMSLKVNVFRSQSAYSQSARAYIDTLLYLIDYKEFETVYDFMEELETLNRRLEARIGKTKAPIQIATVHEFKGKERDSVYIWNDSEGVFPSSKCDTEDEEQLQEERRVHYIACTRARRKCVIYCLRGKVGMFVHEMDAKIESRGSMHMSIKSSKDEDSQASAI